MRRSLNAKLIHKRFSHAPHQNFLHMAKLEIYIGLLKSTPKLSHPLHAYTIAKGTWFTRHSNASTENLDTGTHFNIDFIFFNMISCQKNISTLTIIDNTTSHLFRYPTRSKRRPLQIIKTFIKLSLHRGYKISILRVEKCREIYRSSDLMKICIDHEVSVETNGGCASSINGKVEHTNQTIKNMVHIQILSCEHSD